MGHQLRKLREYIVTITIHLNKKAVYTTYTPWQRLRPCGSDRPNGFVRLKQNYELW